MTMNRLLALTLTFAVAAPLVFASGTPAADDPEIAAGNPEIAALQVGLRAQGLYAGTVDGLLGPNTKTALRKLQKRSGLVANGVLNQRTREALGRYGRHSPLGARPLSLGVKGWDVAALQFALAWHGFPSSTLDGRLGSHTDVALRSFQAQVWASRRTLPRGCRLSGCYGNRNRRGGCGASGLRRCERQRVGQDGRPRPRPRRPDPLRAPVEDQRPGRSARRCRLDRRPRRRDG